MKPSWMGGGGRDSDDAEWARLPASASNLVREELWTSADQEPLPLWVYPLLVAAILAVSSAATAFELMKDVPAVTLAAWRLQLTSVLLLCGAAWQWRSMAADERQRTLASWKTLAGSGTCLAVHFGAWVWGLEHTSLTHSLLLVCSAPIVMAAGMVILRKPITKGEVLGSLLGFAGALFLALGPRSDSETRSVTFAGDVASFAAAIALIGYLQAGRQLRSWMPIYIYAAPVTGLAALLLTLCSLVAEGSSPIKAGADGTFGYLGSKVYAPLVAYLALGPGIVGHTGFNTLLRYLTPLTVALAAQLEPVVGSLIGWAAGVVAGPGWGTYVGGACVIVATCVVTHHSTVRERRQAQRQTVSVQLEKVMGSNAQVEDGLLSPRDFFSLDDNEEDDFYFNTSRRPEIAAVSERQGLLSAARQQQPPAAGVPSRLQEHEGEQEASSSLGRPAAVVPKWQPQPSDPHSHAETAGQVRNGIHHSSGGLGATSEHQEAMGQQQQVGSHAHGGGVSRGGVQEALLLFEGGSAADATAIESGRLSHGATHQASTFPSLLVEERPSGAAGGGVGPGSEGGNIGLSHSEQEDVAQSILHSLADVEEQTKPEKGSKKD